MTRVVVADDQAVVREGLVLLLGLLPGIEVVGSAGDGEAALRLVESERPDVVLMDLRMPRMDGVEATRRIRAAHPGTQVVVLTTYSDDESVFAALRAGARGFLTKDAEAEDIAKAIATVMRGDAQLDPTVQRRLLDTMSQPTSSPPAAPPSTASPPRSSPPAVSPSPDASPADAPSPTDAGTGASSPGHAPTGAPFADAPCTDAPVADVPADATSAGIPSADVPTDVASAGIPSADVPSMEVAPTDAFSSAASAVPSSEELLADGSDAHTPEVRPSCSDAPPFERDVRFGGASPSQHRRRSAGRRTRRNSDRLPDGLTPREGEVLMLIAEGLSNTEIAARLFITEATVKTHINNLFAKARLRDRAQAVTYAYRHGLVTPG